MDQKKKLSNPRSVLRSTGRIPGKGSTGPKLGGKKEKYRIEICKMLALGFNPGLVSQEMKDQFGIVISRHTIRKSYQQNPKRRRTIEALKDRAAAELMKHPLADKRVRLGYLLRALQHALTWGTDKLYFDKDTGKLLGKVEKVQIGAVPALIKEAREEIEGVRAGDGAQAKKKLDLLQVIKTISKDGQTTIIENRIGSGEGETPRVDQPGARSYQVL